jgi:hypothetical protein
VPTEALSGPYLHVVHEVDEPGRDLPRRSDSTERDEEARSERHHDRVRPGKLDPRPDARGAGGEIHGESWRVHNQELAARLGFQDPDCAALRPAMNIW